MSNSVECKRVNGHHPWGMIEGVIMQDEKNQNRYACHSSLCSEAYQG